MPASASDIGAATRDVVVASWADAAIGARYPSARDGSVQPAEGYFDAIADAETVIEARGALIGIERRRFTVDVTGTQWIDLAEGVPQARLIDAEQFADATFLVARIELDLEAETTSYELFG